MRKPEVCVQAVALAVIVLCALAAPVNAHQQRLPIGGTAVTLKTDTGPAKQKFVFRSVRQTSISVVNHNPATQGSWVLVHGTGGRTALTQLHPGYWSQSKTGWVFRDPDGNHLGIRRIVFRTGRYGGTLKIIARGPNWTFAPTVPQEELWVQFRMEDEWFCAKFGGQITRNQPGYFKAKKALAPGACPQVCGDGQIDPGEQCDDGNLDDTDGCTQACAIGACEGEVFGSTFEALQQKIFSEGGCTNAICHGSASAPAGQLNLLLADAYDNLVGHPATISTFNRVEPGDQDLSFLYLKLATATLPGQYPISGISGSPMPVGGAISVDRLNALRLWIRAGAPETGTVAGTAELLGGCLPPPSPNKLPPLDPPAAGTGVQLYAPPWPLPAQSEDEVCYSTYYDFSAPGIVPASAQTPCPSWLGGPTKTCFRYHSNTLGQDPQSHHSIIHIYTGANTTAHPGWGAWTCKGGANDGQACNPLGIGTPAPAGADCGGARSTCSGAIRSAVACLGYGPPDYGATTSPSFGGAQEALLTQEYAPGVYNVLPLKGIVVWNSHAFNLTETDTTMEQYYNLFFAEPADQLYQVQGVFDDTEIFVQNVPPFEEREYCRTFTFPQNARLFALSSHTHRFGKMFRIWSPPNASCTAAGGCLPNASSPIYVSTQYNDPVALRFSPPLNLSSATPADRTYKFCARYDNGATDPSEVKRFSTSPEPPLIFAPGGPCSVAETECIGGVNNGLVCGGNPGVCFGGECDACPVRGGVTTEDEMLIMLGSYYLP